MSVKLQVFNAIEKAIKDKVPDVLTFGLWNNQFEHMNEEKQFNFPCVFVEFGGLTWVPQVPNGRRQALGTGNVGKEQKADSAIITLHCGFFRLDDVDVSFPKIDPIIEKIYFAVQGLGFDENNFGSLIRIEERHDTDHDMIIDWQQDFRCLMQQGGQADEDLVDAGALTLDVTRDLDIEPDTIPGVRTGPE